MPDELNKCHINWTFESRLSKFNSGIEIVTWRILTNQITGFLISCDFWHFSKANISRTTRRYKLSLRYVVGAACIFQKSKAVYMIYNGSVPAPPAVLVHFHFGQTSQGYISRPPYAMTTKFQNWRVFIEYFLKTIVEFLYFMGMRLY